MALETLKPQVPVDQDTDKTRGLEVLRDSGANARLAYDDSVEDWSLDDERIVTEPDVAGGGRLLDAGDNVTVTASASTGNTVISAVPSGSGAEVQFNDNGGFGASSDLTWDGAVLSALGMNLANNNASDTSGDIQIRDDSGGDLFSLTGGPSAKYEGNGAFTLGARDRSNGVGKDSFVSGDSVEASGDKSIAAGFVSKASGYVSVSLGFSTTASGTQAVAMGASSTASGNNSTAIGNSSTASGGSSVATGNNTVASAQNSTALGFNTTSRVYAGIALGTYNQDDVGSGNEAISLESLSVDSKVFAVGVGENPSASSFNSDYIDGRGRVDGLYVTLRDGTYIRHGLQIDRYNGSSYEREIRFPETIQSGSDTSQILVRNPDTNEVEYVDEVDVSAGAISVKGGRDADVTYNSSTGTFTVNVTAAGSEGDFQFRGPDAGISAVDRNTTEASYDASSGAFTFGVRSGTVGTDSVVLGGSDDSSTSVTASAKASTATGFSSEASGLGSFAGGDDAVASGDYSFAFGAGSVEASASSSLAFGDGSTASGTSSVVLGAGNTASGDRSLAANSNNQATGNDSTATGWQASASGLRSLAAGAHTVSKMYAGTAVGAYNEDYLNSARASESFDDSDRMFAVGAGSGTSDRRDAFYATYRDGVWVRHGLQIDRYESGSYQRTLRIGATISSGSDTTQILVRNPNTNELEHVTADDIVSDVGVAVDGGNNIEIMLNSSTGITTIDAVASGSDGFVQVNDGGRFGVVDSSEAEIRFHRAEDAFTAGARTGAVGNNSAVLNGSDIQLNEANGNLALAVGGDTVASGSRSLAGGSSTVASGSESVALGSSTSALGGASTALGDNTEAKSYASVVVGRYNLTGQSVGSSAGSLSASSKMLTVGVGESGSREDGFWVSYGDGTYVRNGLTLPNAVPENDTPDKILVRDASTGRVQKTDPVDVIEEGIDVQGGDNVKTAFASSTGDTVVSVDAAGSNGDFQLNDDPSGLTVTGGSTVARYEGSGAFTFGRRTGNAGTNSVVLSGENNNENTASGDEAVAAGRGNTVSANYGFVGGNSNTVSGQAAAAFGANNLVNGDYAFGTGSFSDATANFAFVAGDGAEASGQYSVAFGDNTTASAASALASGEDSTASGEHAVAMGFDAAAAGNESTAFGDNVEAGGNKSFATGSNSTASGFASAVTGFNTTAANNATLSTGYHTKSRAYGGTVVGSFNEDYITVGQEPSSLNDSDASDRVFAVGVGDDPVASPGQLNYFDGRGRVDGLYVTMRDGTFARHGLQIDRWNGSSYDRTLRINDTISEGNSAQQVLVRNPDTNELEYVRSDEIIAEGVGVKGGKNISTNYNSSTDNFTVDLDDEQVADSFSHTSGALDSEGDNKRIEYQLNQKTSGQVTKELLIDSQGTATNPTVPDQGTWHFEGNVTARVTSANSSISDAQPGDGHVWKIEGVVSSTVNQSTGSSQTRFIGSPSVVTVANDASTQDYNVNVSVTNPGELVVEVTGESGDDAKWTGSVDVEEIQG